MALIRADFDRMKCGNPDCNNHGDEHVLFIHPQCHPDAGVEAYYKAGELHFTCLACERPVCPVKVATE